ncbi:sigma-70 family RNA polymerase sigma factor [Paenibacillus segetis]|uniref:Specialized sigma subunit of RNA polymerase n=1 Tax=Paenibacillus segetis TaxID=1325360 RepID=A0ABQ1YGT5_9BACL|nr:sigma-70 family RNA polymerase sigma factor [Paenibacillus segetis]GGH23888.1 specialized sigma subunit of RNA polymerase [Paenibacillus segetis]
MQERVLLFPLIEEEVSIRETQTESLEFTTIFETYYKRIYNYISYRVSCRYTTEDLTSQVFEKVLNKLGTYSSDKSPLEVWMFAIARNVVNDYFRAQKRTKMFSLEGIKELISKKKDPESLYILGESNDKLFRALDTLNERERNIVGLKFGANLSNIQISRIVDLTESNVGVILYRTMKKLKLRIEDESEGVK